jgi:putative ABC transport system substrate-binding protein
VKRREFISLIGGAAAWPLAARAQRPSIPLIGYLSVRTAEFDAALLAEFHRGLREEGYVEGTNVKIEIRWASGQFDRLPGLAAGLVSQGINLLVATGGVAAARAAKASTDSIPIVFEIGDDPVEFGLVQSLNRPGGNMTGVTNFYTPTVSKQFGLLRELVPTASLIGVLVNPNEAAFGSQMKDAETAAGQVGHRLVILKASTLAEVDVAFREFVDQGAGAILFGANPFFVTNAQHLFELCARYRLPAMYWRSELARAGGLISYGATSTEQFRRLGVYAGRVLKGENPADLPVMQPTKFEFVINLKAAKAIGLTVPPSVLARADEVIE